MNPAKKSIVNGKIVPFEIANSNESFIKPNESVVSEPKDTTIETKNSSLKVEGFDVNE